MNNKVYNLLQWTWGLPQNLLGAGLAFKHNKDPHFSYKGAIVTEWERRDGISLGKYIFVPAHGQTYSPAHGQAHSEFLLEHEYGHSLQSLILGPLYLLLVGLPSMAWNRLPYFERRRKITGKSYYSVIFERTASSLGAKSASSKHK